VQVEISPAKLEKSIEGIIAEIGKYENQFV